MNRKGLDGAALSAKLVSVRLTTVGARATVRLTWQVPGFGPWSYTTVRAAAPAAERRLEGRVDAQDRLPEAAGGHPPRHRARRAEARADPRSHRRGDPRRPPRRRRRPGAQQGQERHRERHGAGQAGRRQHRRADRAGEGRRPEGVHRGRDAAARRLQADRRPPEDDPGRRRRAHDAADHAHARVRAAAARGDRLGHRGADQALEARPRRGRPRRPVGPRAAVRPPPGGLGLLPRDHARPGDRRRDPDARLAPGPRTRGAAHDALDPGAERRRGSARQLDRALGDRRRAAVDAATSSRSRTARPRTPSTARSPAPTRPARPSR